MLKTLDVANARAGCPKGIDDVGVSGIRIVELDRERVALSMGVAHETERAHNGDVASRIAHDTHDRAGAKQSRTELTRGPHAKKPPLEDPDAVAELVGLRQVVRGQ